MNRLSKMLWRLAGERNERTGASGPDQFPCHERHTPSVDSGNGINAEGFDEDAVPLHRC